MMPLRVLQRWPGRAVWAFGVATAIAIACGASAYAQTPVSAGARVAAGAIRLEPGYRATAVASEPLLANPVAFCFDPAGRIFVAETHRIKAGVEDNRDHGDWLDDDLAARTVEDRRAYVTRRMGADLGRFTAASEIVRLVEDRDGDGLYDNSSVFADDFRDVVDGAAAGVMWGGDRLLFTCIPALYELRDADGDGRAEQKRTIAEGFGVHFALFGHDMHGLCVGPDGLIYFSIGDRGFHVETPDGVLSNPDSGAVLRCRADGSGLEVFATGLRNPQELAFNEWGDLFNVDNNSDAGDRARVVHIVEGMDAGWRMSYQYLPDRGPFMRERIWETQNAEQPAAIVPPLVHLTDGPSGLVYYPGTGLSAECEGAFLVCDFLGASSRSGVRRFHVEQAGANYRVTRDAMFVEGVLATDCDFGPDGNLYVADWLEGWTGTGKGRIFRVECDDPRAVAQRAELRELIARAPSADVATLVKWLGHADMRVRLAGQRRLVNMGPAISQPLTALTAQADASRLARVHAIWTLSSLARKDAALFESLAALCGDADPEIRNQAARTLGNAGGANASAAYGNALVGLLADESPRVQASAAISLGKLKHAPALPALLKLAVENDDRDPVLRHAAAMGLAGSQTAEQLVKVTQDAGVPEQLAIVVALRRQKSPLVARFLDDAEERVVLEAARAIWDVPLPDAYGALAKLANDNRATSEPLLRRALAANLALGSNDRLQAVIECGLRADVSPVVRKLAWETVSQWANPSPRDPVHGLWRPVSARPAEQTVVALRTLWPLILESIGVDGAGVVVAAELGMPEALAALSAIIDEDSQPAALRARAVAALERADAATLTGTIDSALASSQAEVRMAARRLVVRRTPERAVAVLRDAMDSGTLPEQQEAIALLAQLAAPDATQAIAAWVDRVERGECPAELVLDALEAAAESKDAALAARAKDYMQRRAAEGPMAQYAMCLEGGDVARGQLIFSTKQELSCRRCHALRPGVITIGPSLASVGAERTRAELLDSIVRPNEKMVEGFRTTSLLLDTGLIVSGILRREDPEHAVLVDPEGNEIVVDVATIEERLEGLSAMPEDLVKHMTPRELRDLVAYLATLRAEPLSGRAAPTSEGHGEDPEAASDAGE